MKRLTDTYFISLDLKGGASTHDLHLRTAQVMNVSPKDLRLCLVNSGGQVTPLPRCDPDNDEGPESDVILTAPSLSFGFAGQRPVYAVLRTPLGWEQPCIVDYPPTQQNETADHKKIPTSCEGRAG